MTSTESRAVDDSTQVSALEDSKSDHEVIDQVLLAGMLLKLSKDIVLMVVLWTMRAVVS